MAPAISVATAARFASICREDALETILELVRDREDKEFTVAELERRMASNGFHYSKNTIYRVVARQLASDAADGTRQRVLDHVRSGRYRLVQAHG